MKTLYARIQTNSSATSALEAIGISINKTSGEAKTSSELIDELAGRWDTLSDAERRNTAVGVAGIYQLSRFNALMLNFKTAQESATTAAESYGSVLREQEEYNKSLEARINRLQTAWYGFASALGSTILYDALVVGTSALETMTNVAESGATGMTALATSAGILGGAILLLSTRVRGYTTSLVATAAGQIATATTSRTLNTAMLTLATGTGIATTAMRAFLAATGIGLVIGGLSLAIGTLTNKMSEIKQESEELDAYLEKNTGALTENKEEVDKLITSLEQLRAKRDEGTGLNVQEEQEYVNLQNRLAELYPALVDHIDANGNAHIKNKDAIAEEVAITKELVQAERELARAEAGERFKDLTKELSKAKKEAQDLDKAVKAMRERGFDEANIAEVNLHARQAEQAYANASAEIQALVLDIADSWVDVGETVNSTIRTEVQGALDDLDLSKLSPEQLAEFSQALSDIMVDLSEAFESGDTKGFNALNLELGKLINTFGLTSGKAKPAINSLKELNAEADKTDSVQKATENVDEFGNVIEDFETKLAKAIASYKEFKSVEEQLSGVTTGQIDDTYDLLTTYELLSNATNRTKEQTTLLKQAQESLSAIYPHLVQNGKLQVDAIRREVESYQVLQEAIKNARDGKLSAEQQQTLATALGVNERIKYLKQEIMAMENAYNTKNKQYQELVAKQKSGAKLTENEIRGLMQLSTVVVSYETKAAELDKYMININSSIGSLSNINKQVASSSSKSTSSQSKANSETSKSIYITDKYKMALEALEVQIDKLTSSRSKYSETSDKFRKSIQDEIKLQEQQLKLMKEQASELQKQISSGKIKQTGNITVPSTTKTTTTSSGGGQVKVSGLGGRITSPQGYRIHPVTGKYSYHAGVDIANPRGTRLDSHVDGKVVASGYNSVSGNYVKIQDSKGFTHFFGHLDKRLAELGQAIKAGTQIGTIGSTGRSTGPHLHYEVKNSSGKYVDAASFLKDVRADGKVASSGGTTTTTTSSGSGTVATGQEAIDQAKSQLNGLLSDIAQQEEVIRQNQERIIESQLGYFDVKQQVLDTDMSLQDSRLTSIDKSHKDYAKVLEYQVDIQSRKQKYLKEELNYLNQIKDSGKLSEATFEEVEERVLKVKDALYQTTNQLNNMKVDNLIHGFQTIIDTTNQLTSIEEARLPLLNTSSDEYIRVLEDINYGYTKQRNEANRLIESLEDLVSSQDLSGEALEKANQQLIEARKNVAGLNDQISQGNFNIIMNVQTNFGEKSDDLDFEINRERELRKMYEEGSDAYVTSIEREVGWIEEKIKANREAYKAQEEQLKVTKLTSEDYKNVTENLEELELGYYQLVNALEETNKEMEDSAKKAAESVADSLIDALKDYYSQKQEEINSDYEKELELAEKRHDKVMQQYKDEMDLYRKNAEEKLELLDRQEAERTYDMEIDDLQSQRQELQNRINRLASATSREDLKLRRDLQKQLGEIDEQIAETRHQRDLELQKQNINDLVEMKEEEITEKEELETERYEAEVERIEGLKEYWNQYYTDLLNDERKFAEIKEQIMNGHLDKVMAEFEGYALDLESTMYKLENTLDGTMKAVGTSIRQNVIDNLREALGMASSFQESQKEGSGGGSGDSPSLITPGNDPNKGKPNLPPSYDTVEQMSEGDFKVILGKYLYGRLTSVATAESTRKALRAKGMEIAAEGRKQGSIIDEDATINGALATASIGDRKRLREYVNSNIGKYVSASHLLADVHKWTASLDTGGTIRTGGSGVDGKGGKFAVVHPHETVLTDVQSDKMFEAVPMLDKLQYRMSNLIDKFTTKLGTTGGAVYQFGDFVVEGDIVNSNDQTADRLYGNLVNSIRNKGVNV